jgi:hypothetical protein
MVWVGQETMILIIQSIEDKASLSFNEKVQVFSGIIEVCMSDDFWGDWSFDDILGTSSAFDIALGIVHSDWFEV